MQTHSVTCTDFNHTIPVQKSYWTAVRICEKKANVFDK